MSLPDILWNGYKKFTEEEIDLYIQQRMFGKTDIPESIRQEITDFLNHYDEDFSLINHDDIILDDIKE